MAILMAAFGLGQNASFAPDTAEGKVAAVRLFSIIDRKSPIDPMSEEGEQPQECRGDIELNDVHFAYPARSEVPIFKGYNLTVKAGQTVALVGASGGGKSTVVSLLERFYDPASGSVMIDNRDIKTLNVRWLREQIGLVGQEPTLFDMSIRENIRWGKIDATDEQIVEACQMANAMSFIEGFPQGLDTQVGGKGTQLSGGQKQRIAIARAIIKNPKILLLDEATSALDSESEHIVQEALDGLQDNRTTIVIAHRLSTIRNADKIAVIYDGVIVEQGTFEELMSIEDGHFSRLARRQEQQEAQEQA